MFMDRRTDWAVITILVFLAISLYYMFFSLQEDYEMLNLEYGSYREQAGARIGKLEQNVSDLESEVENLEQENSELRESYEVLEGEVEETIGKIEQYESDLEDSMEWFSQNSVLGEEHSRIKRRLENECVESCVIKTGCFYLVNSEYLGYEYKQDTETSGQTDKLQSLEDFIENKGGDCEDYSLFYKAEFNSVLEECGDSAVLEGWVETDNPLDGYWLNYGKSWYFEGAEAVELKPGCIYPSVVCGRVYDPNQGRVAGHCVIAFTKEKIVEKEEIEELEKSPVIEPQTGEYLGLLHGSSGISLVNGKNYKNLPSSYIYEIITDTDLFLFSFDSGEWLGYSIFSEELAQKKADLLEFL